MKKFLLGFISFCLTLPSPHLFAQSEPTVEEGRQSVMKISNSIHQATKEKGIKYYNSDRQEISVEEAGNADLSKGLYTRAAADNFYSFTRITGNGETGLKLHFGIFDLNFNFKSGQTVALNEKMSGEEIKTLLSEASKQFLKDSCTCSEQADSSKKPSRGIACAPDLSLGAFAGAIGFISVMLFFPYAALVGFTILLLNYAKIIKMSKIDRKTMLILSVIGVTLGPAVYAYMKLRGIPMGIGPFGIDPGP